MGGQISSKLHRQQIMRALQRMILGLGSPPSAPRDLSCRPISCDSIAVSWKKPLQGGSPHMHKYKLERRQAEESKWVTAHGDLDDEDDAWTDADLQVRPRAAPSSLLKCWNLQNAGRCIVPSRGCRGSLCVELGRRKRWKEGGGRSRGYKGGKAGVLELFSEAILQGCIHVTVTGLRSGVLVW